MGSIAKPALNVLLAPTMGALVKTPSVPKAATPSIPAAQATTNDVEREAREAVLARLRRAQLDTLATSPKGLLSLADWVPQRKSLLGE